MSASSRRYFAIASGVVLLGVFQVWAFAQSVGSTYDLTTETKMKGTVQELKMPAKENSKEGAHLLVKSGDNTIDVYLCPKSFLEDMGSSLAKGDEVSITASKVKEGGEDVFLAREVVKGNDTLVLRDDKGKPVWNWHK